MKIRVVCLMLVGILFQFTTSTTRAEVGQTTIAKWQDDKKAVFLLMFDDSWPSQWQVALPALADRGLIATFYVSPGKGEFLKYKDKWVNDMIPSDRSPAVHRTRRGLSPAESRSNARTGRQRDR